MGPGDPIYIAPEGARVSVCRVDFLRCSPCESARCLAPYGYQQCLKLLSVSCVLAAIDGLDLNRK